MKNLRNIIALLLLLLIPAALVSFAWSAGEKKLLGGVHETLAAYGFEKVTIGQTARQGDNVYFSYIDLDPDKFSTISHISVPADYARILLRTAPDTVTIDGLALTGEFDDQAGLTISGWSAKPGIPFPVNKEVVLNGARLDIYTPAGSLRFEAKGTLRQQADGSAELLASVWGIQNQLRLQSNWKGKLFPDGRWLYDIDIDSANLNLERIQASRVSGWVTLDKSKAAIPAVSGQIDAGKLTFGEISLMNANVTVNGPLDAGKIIATGEIGGQKDMTLSLDIETKAGAPIVAAAIQTPRLDDLIAFLTQLQNSEAKASLFTSLLLTEGNLQRVREEIAKHPFDVLELQIYGPLYDLAGKVIAKKFREGTAQQYVISLDPGDKDDNG